jgi:hypothetical protein
MEISLIISDNLPRNVISPLNLKFKYFSYMCEMVSMRAIDEYQRRRQLRTFFKVGVYLFFSFWLYICIYVCAEIVR